MPSLTVLEEEGEELFFSFLQMSANNFLSLLCFCQVERELHRQGLQRDRERRLSEEKRRREAARQQMQLQQVSRWDKIRLVKY